MKNSMWIGGLVVLASSACHPHSEGSAAPDSSGPPALPLRGERVVVEAVAAEFFEARVLGVDGQSARIQILPGGENKTVELGDVYRIHPPPTPPNAGDSMICQLPSGWVGCRVEARHGARLSVVSVGGVHAEIELGKLIAPTSVTLLNLTKSFERAKDRKDFDDGLAHAPRPAAPHGWKPAPLERVLVHREGGWYVGKVHEIGKKQVEIAWPDSDRLTSVSPDDLIPMPPYEKQLKRGDYALARPASLAAPWQGVRVEVVADPMLTVRDREAATRSLTVQDLVPLGR